MRAPAVLRATARREDWPAVTNSLLVEAVVPAYVRAVALRYSWEGEEIEYGLPFERVRSEGENALWSCLLAVPKERRELEYRVEADPADAETPSLKTDAERFIARFD